MGKIIYYSLFKWKFDIFICCELFYRCLASLNLPAALEDVKGVGIPQSLVEKSNSVQMNGGVKKLETMIRELPELLKRNEEIINEVILMHIYIYIYII